MTWERVRYTCWAPVYDWLVARVGFDGPRRRSIAPLRLGAGDRVLLVGAGTGLDLDHLPRGARVTAVDVTPAMLARLRRRADRRGARVEISVMDARQLAFRPETFRAVVMHLVLAVMAEPVLGLREAERVLAPGGAIAIFDKFLRDDERASVVRLAMNVVAKPLFSDLTRRLGPLVAQTSLQVERDVPDAWRGMYRIVTLRKPGAPARARSSA